MKVRIKFKDQVFNHESEKDTVTIGRATDNDFVVPLDDLSRKHCQITAKGDYLFIMDLGSKNGITLDGIRINPQEQVPVYKGMRIILAHQFECILFEEIVYKDEFSLSLEHLPSKKKR